MAQRPVTINDLLDGQIGLDIECADRVYLNGYVPNLQVGGQIVSFLTRHLGNPIPSPAVLDQIGQRFRRAVDTYAKANDIPVVRFARGQRKVDVMRPLMEKAEAQGDSRVVAIGLAQEYAWVTSAVTTRTASGFPCFAFGRALLNDVRREDVWGVCVVAGGRRLGRSGGLFVVPRGASVSGSG